MRPGPLIAALMAAAVSASPRLPTGVAEIPDIAHSASSAPAGPLLFRSEDLFRSFSEGAGEWRPERPADIPPQSFAPLPWTVAGGREHAAGFLTWAGETSADAEGMLAILLRDGDRWCSPALAVREGSRLRFEAVALGAPATLEVSVASDGAVRATHQVAAAASRPLDVAAQTDLGLPAGNESLCLRARGGTIAVGEARVLAPQGAAPGPRWIVLLVFDAFRGDVMTSPELQQAVPALQRISADAQVYRRAVSPGSHTRAAMPSIFTGRDPFRIDPRSVLSLLWGRLPEASRERIFESPNAFLLQRLQGLGYHSILLGNNAYLAGSPAFSRYSIQGDAATGTVDGAKRVAPLLARYADERVALVYWISTAHGNSSAPRRLYDGFHCGAEKGVAEARCRYRARARHADEALEDFEERLRAAGLRDSSLQVLTGDHGEQFQDGSAIEREFGSAGWSRIDELHGNTTDWTAIHVPLIVRGPGVPAGVSNVPVSTLDIVPTVESLLGQPSIAQLDGQPLPLRPGIHDRSERRFVSYSFCSHSDWTGMSRYVWWDRGCGPRRAMGAGVVESHDSELWRGSSRVATDLRPTPELRRAQAAHAEWVGDRLAGDQLILDCAGLDPAGATISLRVPEGRIVDWGPSTTAYGFDRITSARLSPDARRLDLRVEGYRGRYAVATRPQRAPVILEIRPLHGPPPVVFVGPRQIPMQVDGAVMEPARFPTIFVATSVPPARATDVSSLRLWWRQWEDASTTEGTRHDLSPMEGLLRAWGYIR